MRAYRERLAAQPKQHAARQHQHHVARSRAHHAQKLPGGDEARKEHNGAPVAHLIAQNATEEGQYAVWDGVDCVEEIEINLEVRPVPVHGGWWVGGLVGWWVVSGEW